MNDIDEGIIYLQTKLYEELHIKHTPYEHLRNLEKQINKLLECKYILEYKMKPIIITIPEEQYKGEIKNDFSKTKF